MARQYRGYLYPQQIDGYNLVPVCFLIPDHRLYREAARGAVTTLIDAASWDNDDGAPEETRQDVASYVAQAILPSLGIGTECSTVRLQQNPLDPCQLLISYDGGLTWSLAFDYSLCLPSDVPGYVSQQAWNEALWLSYHGTYLAGGLAALAPELTNAQADVVKRDASYCYALARFVDFACEVELARRQQYISGANDYLTIVTAVALAVLSVASVGVGTLLAFGILGALSVTGLTAIGAIAAAVLEDTDARRELACCLLDELLGLEPNATNLVAASSACLASLTGNAGQIAILTDALLNTTQGRAAFTVYMAESYSLATLELLPPCECGDWVEEWLGGQGNGTGVGEWQGLPATFGNNCVASYDATGDKWDSCCAGNDTAEYIRIGLNFPQTLITKVRLVASWQQTRSGTDGVDIQANGSSFYHVGIGASGADEVFEWTGSQALDNLQLVIVTGCFDCGQGAFAQIKSVIIEGQGVNPFA